MVDIFLSPVTVKLKLHWKRSDSIERNFSGHSGRFTSAVQLGGLKAGRAAGQTATSHIDKIVRDFIVSLCAWKDPGTVRRDVPYAPEQKPGENTKWTGCVLQFTYVKWI